MKKQKTLLNLQKLLIVKTNHCNSTANTVNKRKSMKKLLAIVFSNMLQ